MRYVAAYLLAVLGGEKEPSKQFIHNILSTVGIEINDDLLSKVISALNGHDVDQLIKIGLQQVTMLPAGGTAGGPNTGAAAGPAVAASAAAAAEKKEELKKDEKSESESDDGDMGFGLFD